MVLLKKMLDIILIIFKYNYSLNFLYLFEKNKIYENLLKI